ncbi:MAG: hypothetical protein Q7J42_15760, partial [Sulfuritalea sp.]|nr:hypothetical protein [Sulfuritalea sp.]
TRSAGEPVGSYGITQGTVTDANNSNYLLTYVGDNFAITALSPPITELNIGQATFSGGVNNQTYYRPGNFWHVSLNSGNADPGFDVTHGTSDPNLRLSQRASSCDSVFGGGFCETWSFPRQRTTADRQ